MARGAWQQTALLARMLSAGDDDGEVPEFNPFLVGREIDPKSNLAPYDPQYLERLQG